MYSFKIDIGSLVSPVIGNGYIDVSPILTNAKLQKYRDDAYFQIIRLKIEGGLIFSGDEYVSLKLLEDSNELYVPVQCYYNTDLILTGRLDLTGAWDINKNICELPIQTEDTYSDLFKNLDYEIGTQLALAESVKTNYYSLIITQESFCTTLTPSEMKDVMFGDDADLWVWSSSYTDNCTPPYERHIYKSSLLRYPADGYTYSPGVGAYLKATVTQELVQTEFDRFRRITNVIQKAFDLLNLGFTITESTFCDYFNNVDTEMKYLFIADKSDVKRRDSDEAAAFEYITIGSLFELYKIISNLDWEIDNDEFILTYPSAFAYPDFATYPKQDFTANGYFLNLQKYYYDLDNKVNKETWKFENTKNQDFNPQSIIYDNFEESVKDHSNTLVNMDFEYVATDPADITDSGFVVVACKFVTPDYLIINKPGLISTTNQINAKLATTNIITDHMIDADRPYPKGEFLSSEEILGNKAVKIIEYINVPIYDVRELDFDSGVKTELGLAIPMIIEVDLSLINFSKFTGLVGQKSTPIVTTDEITDIASTTATGGGNVRVDNGYSVTDRGICYNEAGIPTVNDTKIQSGTGIGLFTVPITGLETSTVYYVRAYAINSEGVSYGNQVTFVTLGTIPALTTNSVANVTSLKADAFGTVISDGGSTLLTQGFCYAISPLIPTIAGDTVVFPFPAEGDYALTISGLIPATDYIVRAYASNGTGNSYGNFKTFTTNGITDIWSITVGTPAINADEVSLTCYSINEAAITIRFSIYLNDEWIEDDEAVPISVSSRQVDFLIQNPLGTPIPSGTPWKLEVIYDSVTYSEDSGTL